MMTKNSGFMIIELLLAISLMAVVISIAMNVPKNLVRLNGKIANKFNQNNQLQIFLEQFEKDLSTAFQTNIYSTEIIKNKDENKEQEETTKDQPEENENNQNYFVVASQNNSLDYMIFFSTSSVQIETGNKPCFTGIAYLVEQENAEKKVYRAEFYDYDFNFSNKDELLQKIETKHLILKNVKNLEVQLFYNEEKKIIQTNSWPAKKESHAASIPLAAQIKVMINDSGNEIKKIKTVPILTAIEQEESSNQEEIKTKEDENNEKTAN